MLTVVNESTQKVEHLSGAAVVGTDGAGSVVRGAVVEAAGGTNAEERLEHGYKELTLPAGEGGRFALEKHALHIWPRRDFMLIALPNLDGSFTCTLFLRFVGSPSFETLKTPEEVRGFFTAHFPDVAPLLPELESEFFDNPTGSMVTVKCWPWTAEARALLLGDAAHAIVPFFGQGMNCGFEDCVVLDEVLGRTRNLGAAFGEFAQLRKPNADAIADMAVENFVEMRDSVADARFLLEKAIERRLLNALPGRIPQPLCPRHLQPGAVPARLRGGPRGECHRFGAGPWRRLGRSCGLGRCAEARPGATRTPRAPTRRAPGLRAGPRRGPPRLA